MTFRTPYEVSSRRVSTLHPNACAQKNRRNFLRLSIMRLNIFRGGECGSHPNASNDVFARFVGAPQTEHRLCRRAPGGKRDYCTRARRGKWLARRKQGSPPRQYVGRSAPVQLRRPLVRPHARARVRVLVRVHVRALVRVHARARVRALARVLVRALVRPHVRALARRPGSAPQKKRVGRHRPGKPVGAPAKQRARQLRVSVPPNAVDASLPRSG